LSLTEVILTITI